VEDVEAFPGHNACDSRSRSEIVVLVFDAAGALIAVLDLDATGCSSNRLLLLGRRNEARLGLGFGLGQEAEAGLAPREINTYVQQSIGTSAWAGKFHDRGDTVGLSGYQGHRPSRDMVRGDIDA
jgi:hypothetical protein